MSRSAGHPARSGQPHRPSPGPTRTSTAREARRRPAAGPLLLTAEGAARLRDELARLEGGVRVQAAQRLEQALDVAGDLGDNQDYLDASQELELVERRIAVLRERLESSRPLPSARANARLVSLGANVVFEDADTGEREEYRLVSSPEANPAHGRLSAESPVGRALLGHRPGDLVEVRVPHAVRHLRVVGLAAGGSPPGD